ncbi:MAG: hypothetical protein QOF83_3009 [Solirubrobacteraceae bacterium]|jgi:alkanesulfonate monooxygenase SsuD/methylene tetrahydromethanopterin reductase-like flavin-dependent oxidoreductase (luciferase family)|nr:hypothetical protein [Solirubrobacteraceae bacterium]
MTRGLRFGVFLAPAAQDPRAILERARAAERAGFDYISIQDHPYLPEFLDTLGLIAYLAGKTQRVRLMTNVVNLPLRPAPMLAKASATIDLLSGGRFELGLGGGRDWDAIAGLGGPRWLPGETIHAVSEAIDTLRALWQPGGVITNPGGLYGVANARSGPAPAHRVGIWLGGSGPRMLDLLGRKADGWIAPLSTDYSTKPAAHDRIDAGARSAGRDPSEVHRAIQLVGSVTRTPGAQSRPRSGPGTQRIRTTPEHWGQIIREFASEERFDTINFIPQPESIDQIRLFGEEVIPLARAAGHEA